MIYLTGDTHGNFKRFSVEKLNELCKPDEENIFIILGDAGFNYFGDNRDVYNKEKMKHNLPENAILFCVHGNHEMRPKNISSYKIKKWNSGYVYYEEDYPNILFAKDGVFNINNNRILVIGGAYSVDKDYRIRTGNKWFSDEQPSASIKKHIEKCIEVDNNFNYVFSHTCPISYEPTEAFLPYIDQSKVDKSTEKWLETIKNKINYKHWYCGHYHIEKDKKNITFLYHSIIKLGSCMNTIDENYKFKSCNVNFEIHKPDDEFYDNGDGTITVKYYDIYNKPCIKTYTIKTTKGNRKYINHGCKYYLDEINIIK